MEDDILKITKKTDNVPAINNEELRALNSQKVINCVESIDEFVKEGVKASRTGKYYMLVMLILILILIGGAIGVIAIKSGGINNFIDNMYIVDNINKRIHCYSDHGNLTFRTIRESYYFKETFNNSHCMINLRE